MFNQKEQSNTNPGCMQNSKQYQWFASTKKKKINNTKFLHCIVWFQTVPLTFVIQTRLPHKGLPASFNLGRFLELITLEKQTPCWQLIKCLCVLEKKRRCSVLDNLHPSQKQQEEQIEAPAPDPGADWNMLLIRGHSQNSSITQRQMTVASPTERFPPH